MAIVKGFRIISEEKIFTLSTAKKVSIGVYKNDETLVRTLVSNQPYEAGTYQLPFWNGKDDRGNLVADGSYKVKVVSNNVQAVWQGVVGNTSQNFTGSTVHHHGNAAFLDLRIIGNKGIYLTGYNEGNPAEFAFNTSNVQIKLPVWPTGYGFSGLNSQVLCTDGINIYFGGTLTDQFTSFRSFIYARKVSDLSIVAFPYGVPTDAPFAQPFASVIDLYTANQFYTVTGLAVQKSGNYLFRAIRELNSVHVLHKTTGALLQTLTFDRPGYMDTDKAGNLYMITGKECRKYSVNVSTGALTYLYTLPSLVQPVAVQVTPDGFKVYVADADTSQQVKIYNNSNGNLLSTFGQLGGYAIGPDIADNKWMFGINERSTIPIDPFIKYAIEPLSSICFDATDNSWWLYDPGNLRNLHFNSSNILMETFVIAGNTFPVTTDAINPTRLFNNFLEYEIDYSKILDNGNNGSWKLKRNWYYTISKGDNYQKDNIFYRLIGLTTLSNGRTYAVNLGEGGHYYIVELDTAIGLRFTGQSFLQSGYSDAFVIQSDGSLWQFKGNYDANKSAWVKQPLNGFDGSNNPIWGGVRLVASVPKNDNSAANKDAFGFWAQQITSDSKVISWNNSRSAGPHLGAVKYGDADWLWQTSYSTPKGPAVVISDGNGQPKNTYPYQYEGPFPIDGYYDVANGVNNAGGSMRVLQHLVIWQYKGEFWKDAQTNYYDLFADNGLMLAHFGTDKIKALAAGEASEQAAGNAHSMALVIVGNDYYLYHNDEFFHGGVHRWKLTGIATIEEENIPITKSATPLAIKNYVDLMAGLPYCDILVNNTTGWTRQPTTEDYPNRTASTSKLSHKIDEIDVYFHAYTSMKVNRDLGNVNTSGWKISGQINFVGTVSRIDNASIGAFEILDLTGKEIFQFRVIQYVFGSDYKLQLNGVNVYTINSIDTFFDLINNFQDIEIGVVAGIVHFKYADINLTAAIKDNTANWQQPKTFRLNAVIVDGWEFKLAARKLKLYI